jgi:hypothetical protein
LGWVRIAFYFLARLSFKKKRRRGGINRTVEGGRGRQNRGRRKHWCGDGGGRKEWSGDGRGREGRSGCIPFLEWGREGVFGGRGGVGREKRGGRGCGGGGKFNIC